MSAEQQETEPKNYKIPPGQFTSDKFMTWGQKGAINGLLPPGMNPLAPLPDGVTLGTDPLDRESMRMSDNAVRVPTELPSSMSWWMSAFEKFTDVYPKFIYSNPGRIRKWYNSMSLFPTEPRFHLPPRNFVPIWECATQDVVCQNLASTMAVRERKIDYQIVKILMTRKKFCKKTENSRSIHYDAKSYGVEYHCGDIMEAAHEAYMAFLLKWHDVDFKRPFYDMATGALFKQKNRYIEDRFRKRMMANVGAKPNDHYADETASRIVDGTWERRTDFAIEYPITSWKWWADSADYRQKAPFDMDKARFIERQKKKE